MSFPIQVDQHITSKPEWTEVIQFSDEMMVGLRSAAMLSSKMAFCYTNNEFVGLFAECIIFNEVLKRQEQHVIKVDQNFDAAVLRIQHNMPI